MNPNGFSRMNPAAALAALLLTCVAPAALAQAVASTSATDVTAPVTQDSAVVVAEQFHDLLRQGQRDAALQLLAPDVRIFESGYSEDTRDGYAANGHLDDDMRFAAGTVRAVQQRHIVSSAAGDLTCIMLIANIRGKYEGQPVNLVQSETMLLQHEAQGWRIVHIQWSGHSAQN